MDKKIIFGIVGILLLMGMYAVGVNAPESRDLIIDERVVDHTYKDLESGRRILTADDPTFNLPEPSRLSGRFWNYTVECSMWNETVAIRDPLSEEGVYYVSVLTPNNDSALLNSYREDEAVMNTIDCVETMKVDKTTEETRAINDEWHNRTLVEVAKVREQRALEKTEVITREGTVSDRTRR